MKKILFIIFLILLYFLIYDVCNKKGEIYKKTNKNDLFGNYYYKADLILSKMSVDEKIAQIFLVRTPENSLEELKKYQFGGYILFSRDTKNLTKEELKNKINNWQQISKIPLLIAVDEEGGTVVRISNNKNLRDSIFKSSQDLYNEGGFELIKKDTIEKNNLLFELGINVNLAPVADITLDQNNYMYKRSFGKSAEETKKYIKTVIEASKKTKVSNVLKHFPGYGDNLDTHIGGSVDNRTLEQFRNNDFLPFIEGINSNAEAILVSHNIIKNIEEIPASLSKKIHDILKNELNFSGIIMTDDLEMSAINDYDYPSVLSLKAGNDIIITTNYEKDINDIKNALNNNDITMDMIDNCVRKILSWKLYKGLIN